MSAPNQAKPKNNHTTNTSSAESTSKTQGKNTSRFTKYYEYKLDETYDSKGGYLTENNARPQPFQEPSVPTIANRKIVQPSVLPLDPTSEQCCVECSSVDLDPVYKDHFRTHVCWTCKKKYPEKYSLLTKTEVREDYLLTESELRDHDRLPVLKKPNPRQLLYHSMWLYMRSQVEQFAIEKWGSLEALDQELDRRDIERVVKREKKYKKKLSELRSATRTSLWYTADTKGEEKEDKHVHEWLDQPDGQQVCKGCGLVTEVMDF